MNEEEAILWMQGTKIVWVAEGYKAGAVACDLAIAALRAQQERENPEPLTLDELREMDGEPVWLVDGSGNEMWGLVDAEHDCADVIDCQFGLWNGVFYNMTGDGKRGLHLVGWLAYRCKPKEGSKC